MNRPASVKPDNFFLMLYRAVRQHRVPLVLRIASHTLLLVALAIGVLVLEALLAITVLLWGYGASLV